MIANQGAKLAQAGIDALSVVVHSNVAFDDLDVGKDDARAKVGALRIVFAVVIAALAIQMIYLGLTGRA